MKKVLFVFIVLCSFQFFQLSVFPQVALKLFEWVGVGLLFLMFVLHIFYGREKSVKMHFSLPIILIIVSVAISMFAAYIFHDQGFLVTGIAQRFLYFYLLYYVLHFLKIPGEFLVKTFLSMGIAYILIYLIQFNIYPTQIVDAKMFFDRGTLRIFMTGAGFFVVSYFIWLYLGFRTWKVKYFLYLFVGLIVLVLLGTRQMMAAIILLTIMFILRSRVVKSKFLIVLLIASISIPVVLMFQEIFLEMINITKTQSSSVESNIRIEAAKFFLGDYMSDPWCYFTGNGAWGNSRYGIRVQRYSNDFGYFQSDIGLIGEYSKFGLLFVVGVIMILYRVLRAKLPEKLMFIKYNFLGIIMTSVTGLGAFGSNGTNILINCTLLYLVDLYISDNNAFDQPPFQKDKEVSAEMKKV